VDRCAWNATVSKHGKTTVLINGVSRNLAYYAAVHFHHWEHVRRLLRSVP
jgi:hypothetical protein